MATGINPRIDNGSGTHTFQTIAALYTDGTGIETNMVSPQKYVLKKTY